MGARLLLLRGYSNASFVLVAPWLHSAEGRCAPRPQPSTRGRLRAREEMSIEITMSCTPAAVRMTATSRREKRSSLSMKKAKWRTDIREDNSHIADEDERVNQRARRCANGARTVHGERDSLETEIRQTNVQPA